MIGPSTSPSDGTLTLRRPPLPSRVQIAGKVGDNLCQRIPEYPFSNDGAWMGERRPKNDLCTEFASKFQSHKVDFFVGELRWCSSRFGQLIWATLRC